ncbi:MULTISPECIES: hypothetical protein [unclassified Pseudonocardia]|uniref:hypothetical protein n=1 Tax=unclassified Pseudonocardia TaxID=2619320 RepID=UPI0001FFF1E1|nr:hypothetical protein [Pseudonocardia sp. Ae707_Ps1]OLM20685.1 hypothetical protein Ae707Ps1_4944c [Pseudonocardia sp. Ae707_Ps1]
MRPDVQRDPDALDRAAARLRETAADLRSVVAGRSLGDHHRIGAHRIVDELDSLATTATHAATTTRHADNAAAARLRAGVEVHGAAPGRAGSCVRIRP